MSPQPPFFVPLDAPTAADPSLETLVGFTWRHRQTRPGLTSITNLEKRYKCHFGPNLKTSFKKEKDLRNAHVHMLQSLIDSESELVVDSEVSLDDLGDDGDECRELWLNSPLHRRYITEVVRAHPRYANNTDMKAMDLVIHFAHEGILGILAEFKILHLPNANDPVAFHAVWRECFYQAAWYLAGAHYMVGTGLALAVVNSRFQRLHMSGATLSVEVHADSTPTERGARTIAELETSTIWDYGMPHDFQDSETYKFKDREFALYRDTYAQGAILASKMRAAQPNEDGPQWTQPTEVTGLEATVGTSFGYDDQIDAAGLKKQWKGPSDRARRKPKNPNAKNDSGRKPGGGAGGSSASSSKKQYHPPKQQSKTSTTQATPTRRSERIRTQASRSKRRRVLSVIFPWRWFRHNGKDDDDNFPPASQLVPPVLSDLGYTIRLVTPQEMDKLINASISHFKPVTKPARTAAAAHHPRPTTHRPMPNTHRPTPASLRPTPAHHGRMHTTHHPLSPTHRPMPTAHRPWPPSPVHGLRQGYPVSGMGGPSRMTAAH